MNRTLATFARQHLKSNLPQCTAAEQLIFKRMYSPGDHAAPLGEVVDRMPDAKLDWAMEQVERTLAKRAASANITGQT